MNFDDMSMELNSAKLNESHGGNVGGGGGMDCDDMSKALNSAK